MAIKEQDIRELFKVIQSSTMQSVRAGNRQVIAPTTLRQMSADITSEAESGSIRKFESALLKAERIVDKLKINIEDFNKGLQTRLEELKAQKDESEKEVEELREQNIIAETKTIKEGKEFRIETRVLSNKEIAARQSMLDKNKKLVDREEKKVIAKREKLLEKEDFNTEDQAKIIADQKRIAELRERLLKEEQTLSPLKDDEDKGTPRSVTSFYEALKEPFVAVGDAFLSIRDGAMEAVNVFNYFRKGGFMKSLKSVRNGLRAIGKFFMSTKVLIGLAIFAVIGVIYKFRDQLGNAIDFIKTIPERISNFFKGIFIKITDFYKTMINAVIKLINKIPGISIPLLETSKMKVEKEEKEKQKRIKEATAEGEMGMAVEQKELAGSDYDDDTSRIAKQKMYDEGLATQKIDYTQVARGGDLDIRGVAPSSDGTMFAQKDTGLQAKELSSVEKESASMASAAPIVVNNSPQQSNISSSGTTVSGFISNKNTDDTFINLSSATV